MIAYKLGEKYFRSPPPSLFDASNRVLRLDTGAGGLVLEKLLTDRSRVVSRDELMKVGWPDVVVGDNNLDRAIANIRERLEHEEWIETTRKRRGDPGGYRYIGPCDPIAAGPGPTVGSLPVATGPSDKTRRAWLAFARTVVEAYEGRLPDEFPYAARRPDIPIRATRGELQHGREDVDQISDYHFDAVPLLLNNLKPRTFTLLVGEYGSGKTYLAGTLAYRLAKQFVEDAETGYLPVILPLRQTTSLTHLDTLLQSTLFGLYSVIFSPQAFVAAHQAGKLVLILDGLDEMISRTDRKDLSFHLSFLIESAMFGTTPIVLTTRPNVLPAGAHQRTALNARCTLVTIDPLDTAEVRAHLTAKHMGDVLHKIDSAPVAHMADLLSRPLYVEMIIAAADLIRSSSAMDALTLNRLYDFYFQYWYDRELHNIGAPPGQLDASMAKAVLARVAHAMSTTRKPFVAESALREMAHDVMPDNSNPDTLHTVFTAAKERLILVPEFGDDEPRYSFRHDSMRSYFTASHLAHLIRDGGCNNDDLLGLDIASVDFLFGIAKGDDRVGSGFSAMSTPRDKDKPAAGDVLAFLWAQHQTGLVDPQTLVWLCAGDADVRELVGRHLLDAKFPKCSRFDGLVLEQATMRGARLEEASFVGGTLAATDLRFAELERCVFEGTRLDETKFGALQSMSASAAKLAGSMFKSLKASGATFAMCLMPEANLDKCVFSDADFTNATMTGARVSATRFVRVTFGGADLRTARFSDCVFEDCTFSRALIAGAKFDKRCRFDGTDLTDAIDA